MIISSFEYKENGWELKGLAPLNPQSLLVARNATGKTRTIRALHNVTSFLQMKGVLMATQSFETCMTFKEKNDPDWVMKYCIKIKNGNVEKEKLMVNDVALITRTKTIAMYKKQIINPPADKLVVQIRRDENLYPDIEKLINWAEGVTYVSCSDINPYTIVHIGTGSFINPYSFSELVDNLTTTELKKVLSQAKELGYDIASIRTIEASKDIKLVQVKEKSVVDKMVDMQLSSGMIRTLYLLCFVSVVKHYKKLSMLLVDDLGEGLDYRRSTDFGRFLFEDCLTNGIQLIASSNDSFLMDVVDIANWQVLRRKSGKVSVINQSNSPELFRKFKMTGLSNFDLFSSDFIDSYLASQR